MDRGQATKVALDGLIWGRMSFGLAAWLAPRPVGDALGLDMAGNPQAPYLARILAVRDVALALGARGATGEARRRWLLAGMACDGADVAAGIAAGRSGYLPARTSVAVTAFALSGVGLAVTVLSFDRSVGVG
jgi:hypothetical protein